MTTKLFVIALLLALQACASRPVAPNPAPETPKPPKVAAWILQPVPSSLPLLDKLIQPFEKTSSPPK